MDPLDLHHVIRHPLSRIETSNFQDKSGCSINGFRSFLFEEGIVQDLDGMEDLIYNYDTSQDHRGYPIHLDIRGFDNFPLSDKILRMKNINFYFRNQPKPIHKLVSPEPHFVEEERDLIKNHFSYLGSRFRRVEDWRWFEMDNEGHLVSIISYDFQLSNESIEHLSNFPHLRNLEILFKQEGEPITNFSLLSNLRKLEITFENEFEDPELFKDLGLFTNLILLKLNHPIKSDYIDKFIIMLKYFKLII